MEGSVIDLMLNGSPMVAFAVFLIYLYKTQQARMDGLVERFQIQQEQIRQEYKTDVEVLRERYDVVFLSQNKARDRIKDNIEETLRTVQNHLQNIHSTCQGISISQEVSKNELEVISKDVEAGLKAVKEMQEQAKLREIAKQAIQNRT